MADDMSIGRRAHTSLAYRSKGYVDDCMAFARWILELKETASDPEKRAKLLKDLDETLLP